ncbi:hypothetical protein AAVH_16570 [Aphelenchoides avenae]|nr:hypothetical protein AAVH_16570 [Aphelenchus avenae]
MLRFSHHHGGPTARVYAVRRANRDPRVLQDPVFNRDASDRKVILEDRRRPSDGQGRKAMLLFDLSSTAGSISSQFVSELYNHEGRSRFGLPTPLVDILAGPPAVHYFHHRLPLHTIDLEPDSKLDSALLAAESLDPPPNVAINR